MSYNKSYAPNTKEGFAQQLVGRIVSGKLAVGEKLPTEREFERQTGLKKSVIHCALIELEHKGFINILPRKGSFVNDYARRGTADTLNEVLRVNGGRLSFKMSVELVELRNAVEGAALIRLAANHTNDDMARLKAALEQLKSVDAVAAEIPEIAALESAFHLLICELSGNTMLALVMNSFTQISAVLWQSCALFWGLSGFIGHDERLIDMIERGEGREAHRYIEGVFARFLEAFCRNEA